MRRSISVVVKSLGWMMSRSTPTAAQSSTAVGVRSIGGLTVISSCCSLLFVAVACRSEGVDGFGCLVGGEVPAEPAVAEPGGAFVCGGVTAENEWRVRVLDRARCLGDVTKRDACTFECGCVAAP